jgi:ornithine cyclodeaminase/alanine dehydrogenase-like protein (mu-crystallin family)
MIILKDADIKKALSMREALEVNKEAFIKQADQSAVVPERIAIPTFYLREGQNEIIKEREIQRGKLANGR